MILILLLLNELYGAISKPRFFRVLLIPMFVTFLGFYLARSILFVASGHTSSLGYRSN